MYNTVSVDWSTTVGTAKEKPTKDNGTKPDDNDGEREETHAVDMQME